MAKRFCSKKKLRKKWLLEYFLLFLFTFFLLKLCIYTLVDIPPTSFLKIELLGEAFLRKTKENTINNPLYLLNYSKGNKKLPLSELPVMKEEETVEEPILKQVYLYSTHNKEAYEGKKTVVDAALYLEEKLGQEKVQVTVEKGDIQEFVKTNNYEYYQSYVASRYFIKEEMGKTNYDLIVDLHRDAISKGASTVVINGKSYAKILFVIGKENKQYEKNLSIATKLNDMIKKKYPTLTRGILLQSGPKVNGIYNQDLNSRMILLELGGNKNTYEEVKNTIEILAPLIGEYLNGKEV